MSSRVLERKKRRLPCEIRCQSQKFSGMVLELSASGLFVQTSARVGPGKELELAVGVPGRAAPIPMTVEVVRAKRVPPQLLSVAQGGLGARIVNAPEAFYEYLTTLDPIVEEAKRDAIRNFQVRARQVGGPRTKRLFLDAEDAVHAREVAAEHLGETWEILESSEA